MLRMKRGAYTASMMVMVTMIFSACTQPYSTPSAFTSTPINQGNNFATPLGSPTPANGLGNVEASGTQTAQAINPSLLSTFTPGSAPQNPTATLTPFIQLPITAASTSTATLALPSGPTNTPQPQVPPGSNPQTYSLQRDEFPFCIARRYGVDPTALLRASNLTSPDIYYAGLVLTIPSGPAWSEAELGPRSLRTHPGTYVVTGNADTSVFGVACKFGDVRPDAIVSANPGVTLNAALTVNQSLNIP